MERLRRRLLWLVLLIAAALASGTIGFTLIEGFDPFDAFYMTLTTITTVGYAEIQHLSRAGRVFNSFVIVFGVTTMFFAIGAMTQTVIEMELGEFFGKRRMKRMIDKLEKHYIVCGYGRVGRAAMGELRQEGVAVVVVDRNPEKVERAIRDGVPAFCGDSTQDASLEEAGVRNAKGLIAALATDADNLFLILSAKTLNPVLKVAARAGDEKAEEKFASLEKYAKDYTAMAAAGKLDPVIGRDEEMPATNWRCRWCGRTSCNFSTSRPRTSGWTSAWSRCGSPRVPRWLRSR